MLKEEFIRISKNDFGKYEGFNRHKDYESFFRDLGAAFDATEKYKKAKSGFEKESLTALYEQAKSFIENADTKAKKMSDDVLREDVQSRKIMDNVRAEADKIRIKNGLEKKAKALLDAINKCESELKSLKIDKFKYEATDKYYHSYIMHISLSNRNMRDLKSLLDEEYIFKPDVQTR